MYFGLSEWKEYGVAGIGWRNFLKSVVKSAGLNGREPDKGLICRRRTVGALPSRGWFTVSSVDGGT